MAYISNDANTLFDDGDFTLRDMPRLLAAMHTATNVRGYRDITLDFSRCTRAYAGPMLGVAAHAQSCWSQGIDVELKLPADSRLARLFTNANWANLIDPRSAA